MTGNIVPDVAFDQLFRTARSVNAWQAKPVPDDLLVKIHDIAKFGPTSANCCPLRIVFLKTDEAKARLKPALDVGNVTKIMTAPVVAIFAYDLKFYDQLPKLFPHDQSARSWFAGNDAKITTTVMRNGSLQAAYYMITARGLGLDCGPISGFDNTKVNAEFFADGQYQVNFICAMGYADHSKTYPRNPRLTFEEMAKIL